MKNHSESLQARNDVVRKVIALLASGEYSALQILSGGKRLSAKQIKTAVEEYGRSIIPIPETALDKIDYVLVTASQSELWSVCCPIFTIEEGLSDLTFELNLGLMESGGYEVELDGLHVL